MLLDLEVSDMVVKPVPDAFAGMEALDVLGYQ